jgi:glutaminase
VCQGRVLDYKRKFIEAASRYNELSYKTIIHEDERMTALKNAIICTILASAGNLLVRATSFLTDFCAYGKSLSLFNVGLNSFRAWTFFKKLASDDLMKSRLIYFVSLQKLFFRS